MDRLWLTKQDLSAGIFAGSAAMLLGLLIMGPIIFLMGWGMLIEVLVLKLLNYMHERERQ